MPAASRMAATSSSLGLRANDERTASPWNAAQASPAAPANDFAKVLQLRKLASAVARRRLGAVSERTTPRLLRPT